MKSFDLNLTSYFDPTLGHKMFVLQLIQKGDTTDPSTWSEKGVPFAALGEDPIGVLEMLGYAAAALIKDLKS